MGYEPPLPAIAAGRLAGDEAITKMATYAIHAADELGVLAALNGEATSVDTLAERLSVDAGALARLLGALAGLDMLEVADGGYRLGPLAPFAGDGAIGEVNPDNPLEFGWVALAESVRTGAPAFDRVHGSSLFEYLSRRPEAAQRFHRRMRKRGEERDQAVAEVWDIPAGSTIVDVGGGTGSLLSALLKRHPTTRGVLFDLPDVIRQAGEGFDRGVRERITLVSGDMFESVAPGGDVYVLSSILHDWGDEAALEVLTQVRRAVPSHGILGIVEHVLPVDVFDVRLRLLDLEMLVLNGGCERSESAFGDLLKAAGFRLERVLATRTPYNILLALPAKARVL